MLPAAMTGTFTASAICGTSAKVPTSCEPLHADPAAYDCVDDIFPGLPDPQAFYPAIKVEVCIDSRL
jgi:hypothetical protein